MEKEENLKDWLERTIKQSMKEAGFYTADDAYSYNSERTCSNFRDDYIRQEDEQ